MGSHGKSRKHPVYFTADQLMLDAHDSCAVASVKFSGFLLFVTFSAFLSGTFIHWILWKAVTKLIYIINYGTYVFFHSLWRFPKIYIFLLHRKADKICFPLNVFSLTESFGMKGGPGAAVEPTVCNRKVPGSSPSLCTFVWVRLGA